MVARLKLPPNQKFLVGAIEAAGLLNRNVDYFDKNIRYSRRFLDMNIEKQGGQFSTELLAQYAREMK
ncbi:hypothetical protein R5Q06_03270 [Oenococcus oeni]|nr:hypothetical protein [Oenococcus oeni]KGH87796.1 hypothetical protein X350_06815 [Oenococcus oeni S12]OIK85191.1 hypothetical protein ATW79_09675 [Oenococcus oeni]OIL07648.1 hypothetical protein ATW92_09595 [Oenococcus oeni]OIL11274.1 hypothetical protein ATW93_09750 [Oenococcus oeni]OIL11296.1 hypothetical protein ATW93_09670 [Oenococcus oeni]